jgi:hypothetical protein
VVYVEGAPFEGTHYARRVEEAKPAPDAWRRSMDIGLMDVLSPGN